ncbi:MAG TPA: fluoride efflux transporter CrcB [Actinomycetota bacterium]
MATALIVGVAGAIGTLARYGLDGLVSRRFPGAFPLGTFVVNITGALLLGLVFTVLTERFMVSPSVRSAITIGLLGAYTTFSTLSLETLRLIEDGAYLIAAANALGTLAVGLVAVYVGVVLGRAV